MDKEWGVLGKCEGWGVVCDMWEDVIPEEGGCDMWGEVMCEVGRE